jgi:hypothetical protein
MSEPSFRIEPRKDGYNVFVADTRREIYPMADGRWFVLGWARQFFDTKELAAVAVADRILSEVRS